MKSQNPMKSGSCPYEINDVLTTFDTAHPSTRWPGTQWTQITTMLLGASETHPVGSTGGAESTSYTPSGTIGGTALTTNQMPAHSHVERWPSTFTSYGSNTNFNIRNVSDENNKTTTSTVSTSEGSVTTSSLAANNSYGAVTTGSSGGGQTHTHSFTGTAANIRTMPPYTAVYFWRRTG